MIVTFIIIASAMFAVVIVVSLFFPNKQEHPKQQNSLFPHNKGTRVNIMNPKHPANPNNPNGMNNPNNRNSPNYNNLSKFRK